MYCQFQSVFFRQIILYFMSQLNMFTRMKIASKEQNLEYKCVLQESYKTMRRWQRPILLVEGGHCVGD